MKLSLALCLGAATSVAVGQRAGAGKTGNPVQTQYKFVNSVLKPQFRLTGAAKRTKTRIGPFTLLPGNSGRRGKTLDPNGQGFDFQIPRATLCGGIDCTVVAGKPGLELEDGTPADVSKGVYIHHILSTNQKKNVVPFIARCDTPGDVKSVRKPNPAHGLFIGFSDDNANDPVYYGTSDGKLEGGYWLSKEDTFGIWADLVNLNKDTKKVYVTYDLEYLPGHVGTDGQGTLFPVQGCSAKRIAISQSGPTNTTSGKFRLFKDGYILNAKGHLHDGGVAMDMFLNGKYACSSDAVYGGEGGTTKQNGKTWETISAMTNCPGPFHVKDGDYLTLNARYDLSKHPLRQHANGGMAETMGMWIMTFLEEKKGTSKASAIRRWTA